MASIPAKFGTAALLAFAIAFVSPGLVRAAGPYDGNWVLTASGAGGRLPDLGAEQACSNFRLPFQIRDNQVVGNASRSADNPTNIVASPSGSPVTGSVQPDGSFNAQWQDFAINGKITGNTLTANWNGQCGERTATGTRVSP